MLSRKKGRRDDEDSNLRERQASQQGVGEKGSSVHRKRRKVPTNGETAFQA
jgi:hypothetical protein